MEYPSGERHYVTWKLTVPLELFCLAVLGAAAALRYAVVGPMRFTLYTWSSVHCYLLGLAVLDTILSCFFPYYRWGRVARPLLMLEHSRTLRQRLLDLTGRLSGLVPLLSLPVFRATAV